ncbi:voltage-gated potassium channel [Leucogyrophana mollusca]|uniref:Voltage-gated potassium channel n=1 Tax=Leucogyrophana mollusca TaxID=85980 RepID=A0ACB8BH13_9AGAM|nr:voltage-gated potassium channel [Leucogyrophana mollusca]
MSQPIPLTRLRTPAAARFLTEDNRPSSPHDVDEVFPNSTSFDEPPDPIASPWKRHIFDLLERPTSSSSAFLLHFASTSLIVFSAVVTILETVPSFHSISPRVWFGLETTLVLLFTVEYSARCFAWSSSWISLAKWIFSFYGVIDMLAILPYYIEIMLHQDTSVLFRFSILRMFRLLRVFRPFRYNSTILLTIEVMYLAIRRSHHALLALSFFIAMMLVVFSTLLYFAERGTWDDTLETFINADGDPSQFPSIPAAAWFVLVTITTVGYGEITPRSFLGRLITVPLLAFGLLLIALPSFVLGREFSIVWEQMTGDHGEQLELETPTTPFSGRRQRLEPRPDTLRDLSNRKLAQNQTELSHQISELRVAMEMQGEMIKDLLGLLDGKARGKRRESVSLVVARNSFS